MSTYIIIIFESLGANSFFRPNSILFSCREDIFTSYINIIFFAGGLSKKCDEKDISDKNTVKDTIPKALHNIFGPPTITNPTISIGFGGHTTDECQETYHATILKFDPHKSSWVQVGNMTHARAAHGASTINTEDVEKFCTSAYV